MGEDMTTYAVSQPPPSLSELIDVQRDFRVRINHTRQRIERMKNSSLLLAERASAVTEGPGDAASAAALISEAAEILNRRDKYGDLFFGGEVQSMEPVLRDTPVNEDHVGGIAFDLRRWRRGGLQAARIMEKLRGSRYTPEVLGYSSACIRGHFHTMTKPAYLFRCAIRADHRSFRDIIAGATLLWVHPASDEMLKVGRAIMADGIRRIHSEVIVALEAHRAELKAETDSWRSKKLDALAQIDGGDRPRTSAIPGGPLSATLPRTQDRDVISDSLGSPSFVMSRRSYSTGTLKKPLCSTGSLSVLSSLSPSAKPSPALSISLADTFPDVSLSWQHQSHSFLRTMRWAADKA